MNSLSSTVITVINVIIVINFNNRHQQWEFEMRVPTRKTTLYEKSSKRLSITGSVVLIIHERFWYALIPLVRRGATSWIAGIAIGS